MNVLRSFETRPLIPIFLITALGVVGCSNSSSPESEGFSQGTTSVQTTDSADNSCEMIVYAQNELPPFGAAVRAGPSIESEKIGSVTANEEILVGEWVKVDEITYPENPEPWDGGEWFWAEEFKGWVSYPGIRNRKTERVRDENGELVKQSNGEYPTVEDLLKTLVSLDENCRKS